MANISETQSQMPENASGYPLASADLFDAVGVKHVLGWTFLYIVSISKPTAVAYAPFSASQFPNGADTIDFIVPEGFESGVFQFVPDEDSSLVFRQRYAEVSASRPVERGLEASSCSVSRSFHHFSSDYS